MGRCTCEGCVGSFYERDMATVSSQQSAGRVDRQKATHRLRNDRKQGKAKEKAKCQSDEKEETKIDHREGENRGTLSSEGGGTEKHYRQINVISVCVCALRARISGRKSISTTNLVHSGNRTECTLHIYSINRPLLIA